MTATESNAFRAAVEVIAKVDPTIAQAIVGELGNQRSQLKLIASENYASPAVMLAMGNWFSDKYAEFDETMGQREALQTTDPDYKDVKSKLESISAEILAMLKADAR